jgi:hypothetical protein
MAKIKGRVFNPAPGFLDSFNFEMQIFLPGTYCKTSINDSNSSTTRNIKGVDVLSPPLKKGIIISLLKSLQRLLIPLRNQSVAQAKACGYQ